MKDYIYLFFRLSVLDMELFLRGFNKTFLRYSKKYEVVKNYYDQEEEMKEIFPDIENLFSKLDVVCTWYPRKADCIHKTFLGYRIMRSRFYIPVDMNVGVRKFPFEAHAWITCYGQNFFDDEEETSKYNIILTSLKEGERH